MPEHWFVAPQVSAAALEEILRQVNLRWVYVERMEDTILTTLQEFLAMKIPHEEWQYGRAFEPRMEMAWWNQGGDLKVRLVIEEGSPPDGVAWQPDPTGHALTSLGRQDILLIGERDPQAQSARPAWSAARIPRYLYYPANDQWQRVALEVIPYARDGIVCDQRLVQLKGAPANE